MYDFTIPYSTSSYYLGFAKKPTFGPRYEMYYYDTTTYAHQFRFSVLVMPKYFADLSSVRCLSPILRRGENSKLKSKHDLGRRIQNVASNLSVFVITSFKATTFIVA